MQSQPALAFICETESEWVGPRSLTLNISLSALHIPVRYYTNTFFLRAELIFSPCRCQLSEQLISNSLIMMLPLRCKSHHQIFLAPDLYLSPLFD